MKKIPVLQTELLNLLRCRLPILLAGMGGVARHELAAAVCNAGGFGVLGMVREPVERIHFEIQMLRSKTKSNFGVNLIPAATEESLLKAQIKLCLALEIQYMVLFWEIDTQLIRHLKAEGVFVIHQIGSQRDAEAALNAGVDALIVQGYEAGGHVRGTTSTLSLLAQISEECVVPVIASGGIANGRTLLAALACGAQGASLGTAFLATHEANAHIHHKKRVQRAKADDTVYTQIFWRNWHEAAPVRVLHNALTLGLYSSDNSDMVIGKQDGQDVYLYSTDSPLSDATGNIENMAIYCGQSCGQFNNICSVQERINQIIEEIDLSIHKNFG